MARQRITMDAAEAAFCAMIATRPTTDASITALARYGFELQDSYEAVWRD